MSELRKQVFGAALAVENAFAATLKDFDSGVGSFFSGGEARTHEPKQVHDWQLEPKKEASQEPLSWGNDGQLTGMEEQRDYGI